MDPTAPQVVEAPTIMKPAFPSPLVPLRIIIGPKVVLHVLNLMAVFGFMFAAVVTGGLLLVMW